MRRNNGNERPVRNEDSLTTAESALIDEALIAQDRLLTIDEAAAILRLNPKTLANYAWQGVGPRRVRLNSRSIRYRRSDLQAYIDSKVEAA